MPQFTTISPTHIAGQKPAAWERFRDGHYVAIGWIEDVDLTNKSMDEITELIRERGYDNEAAAIQSFERFLSLKPGAYVAVNNTNHGLFGVGKITSGYKFELGKHDSGDGEDLYPHYRDVEWVKTSYMPRTFLVSEGETPWQPYGTVGKVYPELPPYIARLVGVSPPTTPKQPAIERPAFLKPVIEAVETNQREVFLLQRRKLEFTDQVALPGQALEPVEQDIRIAIRHDDIANALIVGVVVRLLDCIDAVVEAEIPHSLDFGN